MPVLALSGFVSSCLRLGRLALLACLAGLAAPALAQGDPRGCGPIVKPGHYGPYDYVNDRPRLEIVERFHFTPKVEALVGGESGYLGQDLSYTLDAFPNHHRALLALINLNRRTKSLQPPYVRLSIECYFDRALRFRPKDTVARTLFAMYLAQIKRNPEALQQLASAAEHAGDNAFSHHNIGMVFHDLGDFDAALRQAHRARKLGFEGTALVDKLKAANRWKEPED